MRKIALALTLTWMVAIAASPVVSATTTVPEVPPAECLSGSAMDTCEGSITVPMPDGSGDTMTCALRGNPIPVFIHQENGDIDIVILCNYGPNCGVHVAQE